MAARGTPVHEGAARRAAPALDGWVAGYRGYRFEGFAPGPHTGMPGPELTFIISLGDPVDIVDMPGGQPPAALQALVGGLHAAPARIAMTGDDCGVAVELTPLAARALFGMPAGELAWQVVELDEVLGPDGHSLADRLASLPTWVDRFATLDAVLTRVVARRRPTEPPPEVREAFRRIVASGGAAPVEAVAREVGWSRRHLAERFREEVGLAPKATARVVRFDRAKRLLQSVPTPRLADVAATAGYSDQAHFTREFVELAGRTPTAWLAEELPFVQDPDDPDAGGWAP